MDFNRLAKLYADAEGTSKRLEKVYLISQFLKGVEDDELDHIILLLQGKLFPNSDETNTGVSSRLVAKAMSVATGMTLEKVEEEWKKKGDLGLVAEEFFVKKKQQTLFSHKLDCQKIFLALRKLATMTGEGSVKQKIQTLSGLFSSADSLEAKYIVRLSLEQMRLGVGEGILRDAITLTYLPKVVGIFLKCKKCSTWNLDVDKCMSCGEKMESTALKEIALFKESGKALKVMNVQDLPKHDLNDYDYILAHDDKSAREIYNYLVEAIQHAVDKVNDYGQVARIAKKESLKGLLDVKLVVGKPIKVMLYPKALDIADAFATVGKPCALEFKYDGFRMQIHKRSGSKDIIIYTRHLDNVTLQFPDVVEVVKKNVHADSFILDAEAVGYNEKTGQYMPFQKISQRIKRKYDIEKVAEKFPVELDVFDVIYLDGKDLLDAPFHERRRLLSGIITPKQGKIMPSSIMITDNEEEAKKFYQKSLDAGNEGMMMKNLEGIYKPGSRVGYGMKIKPVMESLDLVVTGAQWGEGKRAQWLTSFTVACVDEEGNLVELGKVGTGIKEIEDEDAVTFNQLTEMLRPLIVDEKGKDVVVKPKFVIEVHYEEIQKSPSYSSGYALRFPRVVRLREDRGVDDITDLHLVEELYNQQRGRK